MSSVEKELQAAVLQTRSRVLTTRWNSLIGGLPLLELDSTWPSIGTLDLITFALRGREILSPKEDEIAHQSIAYLADYVASVWRAAGAEVKFFERGEEARDLEIRATLPDGAKIVLPIDAVVRRILREAPTEVPVFSEFIRPVTRDYNFLSLLTLGLALGQSTVMHSDVDQGDLERLTENGIRELARTSANIYSRVFPDEPLGGVAELYLQGLVFPPTMMAEQLPGLSFAESLHSYLQEVSIPREAIVRLAERLIQVPDERLSIAGFVLFSASAQDVVAPELMAVVERERLHFRYLRPVVSFLRELLFGERDWIDELGEKNKLGNIITASERIEFERLLGFFPWLTLPTHRLAEVEGRRGMIDFVQSLAVSDLSNCLYQVKKITDDDPADIDWRLQQIALILASGDVERVERETTLLLTEPLCETRGDIHHLRGLALLIMEERERSLKVFETARALISTAEGQLYLECSNNYAWNLLLLGRAEEALKVLERVTLHRNYFPSTLLRNRYFALMMLGRQQEAEQVFTQMLQLSPLDRKVSGSLLVRLVS